MQQHWLQDELRAFWALTEEEMELLKGRTDSHRLGFSLLLKFFQLAGYFPRTRAEIPKEVVCYLAEFLAVDPSILDGYSFSDRLLKSHRAEIRAFFGFRPPSNQDAKEAQAWLAEKAFSDQDESSLLEQLQQWYRHRKIEQPAKSRQIHIVRAAIQASERGIFKALYAKLPQSSVTSLLTLLDPVGDGQGMTGLVQLKSDPGRPSLETTLKEIRKLETINALAIPSNFTDGISEKHLQSLCLRAGSESVWDLRRHPDHVGVSLLALYCHKRRAEIIDGLADLLIQLVHKIGVRAEKHVVQELLGDLRAVNGKPRLLYKLADAALSNPEGKVKDVLYSVVDKETLENLVKEYQAKGPGYQRQIQTLVCNSYRNHYRRMVPKILTALEFCSNNAHHRPVIEALDALGALQASRKRFLELGEVPIDGIIPDELRPLVIESDVKGSKRLNRIHYEVCVLQALRERLRCKEIWIEDAKRYCNPDHDVPQDFQEKRNDYYNLLDLPMDAETLIANVQRDMRESLAYLNQTLPQNEKVSLHEKGKKRIRLTPLDPQPEPMHLRALKGEIGKRWPMTSLLDVLKETELRVGFTSLFKGLGNREILDRETLQHRLLLCLYGLGSNTGLKRLLSKETGATYDELLYVKRRYIYAEPLRAAIARVANAIFDIRQPHIWGEGTTACASDSKKFGAWDQNLMTEWHIRYRGRGVMIYWHVEKNANCIYSGGVRNTCKMLSL